MQKYMYKLKFVPMTSLWWSYLGDPSDLSADWSTLDAERSNIEIVIADIHQVREQWNAILSGDKLLTQSQ
jgi:hypothetical protein